VYHSVLFTSQKYDSILPRNELSNYTACTGPNRHQRENAFTNSADFNRNAGRVNN